MTTSPGRSLLRRYRAHKFRGFGRHPRKCIFQIAESFGSNVSAEEAEIAPARAGHARARMRVGIRSAAKRGSSGRGGIQRRHNAGAAHGSLFCLSTRVKPVLSVISSIAQRARGCGVSIQSAIRSVVDATGPMSGRLSTARSAAPTRSQARALNARFPGQWFQMEAGLHYNWHRHYDPRWEDTPSPTRSASSMASVYAYARSRPTIGVDRDGRWMGNSSATNEAQSRPSSMHD